MTFLHFALLLTISTIAEATFNLGDEPIDRANLDEGQSEIVWFASTGETQSVISVATKFEIFQKEIGAVHIGLWTSTVNGLLYINGHVFDLPTAGYHSITLTPEQRFLVDLKGYSYITVQHNNVGATVPYNTVSCAGRQQALSLPAISNLNPLQVALTSMNSLYECRAYSANIELEPACTPGHFSWNKIAPCQQCATNFYQENYGETECQRCPSGHINDGPGSDNATECYAAPGGDLDPHFMISNHNNEHFCFDYVGKDKDIITLVDDQPSGIFIQGQLFGASPTDATVTYFANILISHSDGQVNFTREDLTIGAKRTPWTNFNDVTDVDNLVYRPDPQNEAAMVDLDDVSVVVTRHNGKIGHYLGIYLSNIQGISDEADGILGKFMHDDFVHTEENGKHFIIHQLVDQEVKVAVHLLERFSPSTEGSFMCYVADDSDDMLKQIALDGHQAN